MTTRRIIILTAIINLAIVLATVWLHYNTNHLNIACQGNLTMEDSRNNNPFTLDALVEMHFMSDGSGAFNLTGDASVKGNHFTVSRQESFTWRHVRDALYEITITDVQRYGHDTVPEGVFERFVSGIGMSQKRMLQLTRTPDDALVIGNFYSPLLVCAG